MGEMYNILETGVLADTYACIVDVPLKLRTAT